MRPESLPPSGGSLREKLRARQLLAKMKRLEFAAEMAERPVTEGRPSMPAAAIAASRSRLAAKYRDAIGVPIENRAVLRETLEQIAIEGRRSVADVVEELRDEPIHGS